MLEGLGGFLGRKSMCVGVCVRVHVRVRRVCAVHVRVCVRLGRSRAALGFVFWWFLGPFLEQKNNNFSISFLYTFSFRFLIDLRYIFGSIFAS